MPITGNSVPISNTHEEIYSVGHLTNEKIVDIAIRYIPKGIKRLNIVNFGPKIGPGFVRQFRKLTHLDLTASMAREGLQQTLLGISRMRKLVSLKVAGNDIGSDADATDALGSAIIENSTKLTQIDISGNSITVGHDMATCLSECRRVHTMIASGNHFDGDYDLFWFLRHMERLEHLELRDCGIDSQKAADLAKAVLECDKLYHLDLRGNPLGEEGIRTFANALSESESVIWLIFDRPENASEDFKKEIEDILPAMIIEF